MVRPLTVLLDLGGVITDKRQQAEQWQSLVGVYFAPLYGRTIPEWNAAHQRVTEWFSDQEETILQATPDFLTFHATYSSFWLRSMCALLELSPPPESVCVSLADQAIASISSHVQAALPGAVDAIQTLHAQGYLFHTASGAASFEVAGYLKAVGVRSSFGRCYGADLINTFKQGPAYFEHLFTDAGLRPAEALVVDDSSEALRWATLVGAQTVLVSPSLSPERGTPACIKSLAELPGWLQQQPSY